MNRLILFVCTGNTCRSPMAEAIARQLDADMTAAAGGEAGDLTFESAGVAAAIGSPATEEAVQTVRAFHVDLTDHRARGVSPALLRRADRIYCMTRAHLAAVLSMDSSAEAKTELLARDGSDISDPIGAPLQVYRQTADQLCRLIEDRLKELRSA